ncbi:MAG: methylmalonyl Co-A mutase-associated GTPase MeaB [Bacteroidota bacterium]|nr:methylmalonyl Co-A mutase-associated GTPase MeaB [Bacteroidota bacterium]
MSNYNSASFWVDQILAKDLNALSKALTLIESQKKEDQVFADELIKKLGNHFGTSKRIAITGSPGAGKSSLIELLGLQIVNQLSSVAVLSIDPSSYISKGSILGDKTRMHRLSLSDKAFVRPSPSSQHLGGVAANTQMSIWLCEAAGFEYILIETVGVGQSEIDVSKLTDMTVLVLQPGSGDDLQGIKKGVMEWADLFVVSKSDGIMESVAQKTAGMISSVASMLINKHEGWKPKVIQSSNVIPIGIQDILQNINDFFVYIKNNSILYEVRNKQLISYFREKWETNLLAKINHMDSIAQYQKELEGQILLSQIRPEEAVNLLINFTFAHLSK